MDDAAPVCRIETLGDLNGDAQCLVDGQRPAAGLVANRAAVHERHGDEQPIVDVVDLVDGADCRMIQHCRGARFSNETAFVGLAAEGFALQELQGHHSIELGVLGLVDHSGAAFADPLQNSVVRNRATDHASSVRGRCRRAREMVPSTPIRCHKLGQRSVVELPDGSTSLLAHRRVTSRLDAGRRSLARSGGPR